MNLLTRKIVFLISLTLTAFPCSVIAADNITVDFLEDYVWLQQPEISPDGKKIAFVRRIANFDSNEYENALYLYDLERKTWNHLAHDKLDVTDLGWTASGQYITYLASDDDDTAQVFRILPNGRSEQQITHHATSIVAYALSPNDKEVAFMARESAPERTGDRRHLRSFEVGYDWYLADEAARPIHLWIKDIDAAVERKLTAGHESYSPISGNIDWSPDGEDILYSAQPRPHSSEYLSSRLQSINVNTKSITVIDDTGRVPRNPKYADDGMIYYSKSQGKEFYFTPSGIYNDGDLVLDIDRNVRDFYFLPEGHLLVGGPDGTEVSLWYGQRTGSHRKLRLNGVYPSTADMSTGSNGSIVFVGTTSYSGPELYYMENFESEPQKLTSFNRQIAEFSLGKVEGINWTSTDDNEFYEDGVLTYPPDYVEGRKYPLVLFMHGGPMGMSLETFDLYAQSFAAQGWLVFQPNYRGSSNLGFEYQRSVINDAGVGPGKDVMAGIEKLVSMGIVDKNNMAVSGWSYGGYMTVWLTSHYQGWKAAVAGASVTDWFDWYTLSEWNVWSGKGLGGSPWLNNNAENYRRQSPITYAHNIKTPTLILSNTLDPRVPVTNSFKLFSNLKDNGVETTFIAYPLPGHFPQDPVHRKDVYERWTAWIRRHFD